MCRSILLRWRRPRRLRNPPNGAMARRVRYVCLQIAGEVIAQVPPIGVQTTKASLRWQGRQRRLALQVLPTSWNPLRLPTVSPSAQSSTSPSILQLRSRSGEASRIGRAYSELETCKELLFGLARASDDDRERMLSKWITKQEESGMSSSRGSGSDRPSKRARRDSISTIMSTTDEHNTSEHPEVSSPAIRWTMMSLITA